MKSRQFMRIISVTLMVAWMTGSAAWGAIVVPPIDLLPLNQIAVPEPPSLFQFVKNKTAAIRLGKALFWDLQAGSDGMTACASCHFNAGADNRIKNTVNPGTNDRDELFEVRGPNQTLQPGDFPFHQRQAPAELQASPMVRDSNDVVGSQGVHLTQFVDIVAGSAVESGASLPDPIFRVNGANVRQVTGRNTPSVINSVFNFSNFWDGKASAFFNGSSPFGPMDPTSGVWYEVSGALAKQRVNIEFASLASQATGPPLSEVEMSFRGRTFPQIGRKMLGLTPLGQQSVHPQDSVLGVLSLATLNPDGSLGGQKGLGASYAQMIRDAFQGNLWNSSRLTPDGYTQMQANFALFWGLAIQLYEATLVSDDTPFDRFLGGDSTALTDQQQEGFNTFFGVGRCDLCHFGSELTNASVRSAGFINNASHALIELMPVASGKQIIYDNGFNNTAVRKTSEDPGRGGDSPFLNALTANEIPLSFSLQSQLQAVGLLPFPAPILPGNIPPNFPVANDGAFKVPGLRNIELTAPYFHNGGVMALEDVVDFYVRGGDFPNNNKANLDINIFEIAQLQNEPDAKAALVAFLKSFTDDRVRMQSAPFDHPELVIPHGEPETGASVTRLPATGFLGLGVSTPVTLSVTSNLGSPQTPGTPITFTAAGQGGIGSYEYRFWLNDGSGAGFVMQRDYGPAAEWTWTPAASGNYDIFVEVRNAGSQVLRDAYTSINYFQVVSAIPATSVTLSPSLPSPRAPGSTILFIAAAQGGSGPYEYRFWLNNGSGAGYVMQQDYGASNVWAWTPGTVGNYDIFVETRNIGSTALREAYNVINYYQVTAALPATVLSLTSDLAAPQAPGTPITFTAVAQGGSGSYEYRFWLNDGSGAGYVLQQDYTSSNTWLWTPGATGNYDVFAETRSVGSAALRDAFNSVLFYRVQ
ncbi:hypothetical protein EG829_06380 [bacterium]|nr:hypothetical protein [bacterium]